MTPATRQRKTAKAKQLFVYGSQLTAAQVAIRIGVKAPTVRAWIRQGNWRAERQEVLDKRKDEIEQAKEERSRKLDCWLAAQSAYSKSLQSAGGGIQSTQSAREAAKKARQAFEEADRRLLSVYVREAV